MPAVDAAAPLRAIAVAGTQSGVGKTTVALGLIGALRRRGLTVQAFKVGPDFIDPLHHRRASGRPSRNLDGWMLDAETNRRTFARATADADVAVVEGMMGLFDGSEGASDRGSTAETAKLLGIPVLLVVDASALARSAAALVHGYTSFDPELRVAGVVLNNLGGAAHASTIRDAIAGRVPVLGALPRAPELVLPERHLGLRLPHEAPAGSLARLAELVEEHVDLDALLAHARIERPPPPPRPPRTPPRARLAVACDEAFCFYYADNLELLEQAGAALVPFSPLRDPLPDGVDGVYLGGGYPELHGAALAANAATRAAIRRLAAEGGPIYAECGGLLYLARSLEVGGERHAMCGVLPLETRMPDRPRIAYVEVTTAGGLFGAGLRARGHVFHHSGITAEPRRVRRCYRLVTSRGERGAEGYAVGNVLASYAHLHFGSNPGLAAALVERCAGWRSRET